MSADKVAARWGDAGFTHTLADVAWTASIPVLMHLNERGTGDPARNWLTSWAHQWFAGNELRVLVLGCGEGWLERVVSTWPFVDRIDAVDLSPDAVERAKAQAPPNVSYSVADLNRDVLPEAAYDVVVAHMILHHIENLEHALAQIERTMKRDAALIINEYAGPNRFQFGDDVLAYINELLACLPPRLRRSALDPAKTYERKERPPLQQMIDLDPSEAVRSAEVMPLLRERFEVLDERAMGGAILHHLMYDIAPNFRFDAPKERAMVELMCEREDDLMRRGAIPSDFVIAAARKRGSRVTKANRPLPPRPEEALDVDHDPLWSGPSSGLPPRIARILLASRQPQRGNLFSENPIAAALARLRRGDLRDRFDRADEDDAALLALLDAIHSAQ